VLPKVEAVVDPNSVAKSEEYGKVVVHRLRDNGRAAVDIVLTGRLGKQLNVPVGAAGIDAPIGLFLAQRLFDAGIDCFDLCGP
jgi:hypothetical protein